MHLKSSPILVTILSLLYVPSILANPVEKRGKSGGISVKPDCWDGLGLFPLSDAQALATELQTVDPDDMSYLPHHNSLWWEKGLVRICVRNSFIAQNTHVMRKYVGDNIQKIIDKCCKKDEPVCEGGVRQGKGDSGLYTDFLTVNAGATC
ncbi:MAG: hypothetical protein L6R42_004333 [Xanthoria sp. 1 TBL-2021]|nr:MAG: hypothetical protein L6R42_004333 [Xanthoria sp. 1 TBL-2021]